MSYSVTEPSDRQKWFAGLLVILYALITMLPLLWIIATGFKSRRGRHRLSAQGAVSSRRSKAT